MISKKKHYLLFDFHFLINHSIYRLKILGGYSSDPFGGNHVSDIIIRP